MSNILVTEASGSRKIGPAFREFVYHIAGTDDEVEVLNAAPGPMHISHEITEQNPDGDPVTNQVTLRKTVTANVVDDSDEGGDHLWQVTVRYEADSGQAPEALEYSLSITTQSVHVGRAVQAYESPVFASWVEQKDKDRILKAVGQDVGVAIDASGNREVHGVDIIVPTATLKIARHYRASEWDNLSKTLITKVGRVNNAPFQGYAAEEVLYAGAEIQRGVGTVKAFHQFMINMGETVDIDGIGQVTTNGWRYLWIYKDYRGLWFGPPAAAFQAVNYKSVSFDGIL